MKSSNIVCKKILSLIFLMTSSVVSISSKSNSEWHPKNLEQGVEINTVEELSHSLDTLKYYAQKLKESGHEI